MPHTGSADRCTRTLFAYDMATKDISMVEKESVGYYRWPLYPSNKNLNGNKSMYGAARVLMLLIGVFIVPATLIIFPLYLRYKVFADFHFSVTEFDVLEITSGISPVFCEAHSLHMQNATFNAYQIENSKIYTDRKKHLRLHKSMFVDDDNMEYWGFYLNRGSTVNLTVCSRFSGGRVMIVKDIQDFKMCGTKDKNNQFSIERPLKQNDEVHIIRGTKFEVITENTNEFEGEDFSQESLQTYRILKERYKHSHRLENSQSQNSSSRGPSRLARSVDDESSRRETFLHGKTNDSNSDESSFEKKLKTCHRGTIVLNEDFPTSLHCSGKQYLEAVENLPQFQHDVSVDGHYFYIFYSDHDEITNEIHAVFDIFKPTFEYSEHVRKCINKSECTFPISFISEEKVIVEIPIQNEIDDELDGTSILVSSCQPRKMVYALFTVAVLVVILLFSFV